MISLSVVSGVSKSIKLEMAVPLPYAMAKTFAG
jgi:hypothetical protein